MPGIPYTTYILEVKNQRFLWPCSMAVFCESCWVSWNPVCHRRCFLFQLSFKEIPAAYSLGKNPWFQKNGWNKTDICIFLFFRLFINLYQSIDLRENLEEAKAKLPIRFPVGLLPSWKWWGFHLRCFTFSLKISHGSSHHSCYLYALP